MEVTSFTQGIRFQEFAKVALLLFIASFAIVASSTNAWAGSSLTVSGVDNGIAVKNTDSGGNDIYFGCLDSENPRDGYDAVVSGVVSGTARYDEASKVLTLNSIVAKEGIYCSADGITLKLTGNNSIDWGLEADVLTIDGPGRLTIKDACSAITIGGGWREKAARLTIKGGIIEVISPEYWGLLVQSGDFYMTGGVFKVIDSYGYAIKVQQERYRGKDLGGAFSLTGGTLTATVFDAERDSAITADRASNVAKCLGKTKGYLSTGISFLVAGNEYKIVDDGVVLTKYGNTKGKTPPKRVSYGGIAYNVVSYAKSAYAADGLVRVKDLKIAAIGKKVYSGKAIKPSLKITYKGRVLKKGTDYKVSYAWNKNPGTAIITVTGIGRYVGSKTVPFTIVPKGTSLSKVQTSKGLIEVVWKSRRSQTSGYQIQYSTNSKFKKSSKIITIKGAKKTSQKISKLASKKKYYVRIRTYKKDGSETYFSAWSKAKAVRTR